MKHLLTIIIFISLFNSSFSQEEIKINNRNAMSKLVVFKSLDYNLGKLKYDDKQNKAEFIFKNISKETIKIQNIETSCGCTEASWTQEEILRKKKGKIYISYDTKKTGKFNEFILVYFENHSSPIQLQIKGEVLKEQTK